MTSMRAAIVGRYLTVGVICALFFNAVMIGGDLLHVNYPISFFVTFCFGTALAYILHVRHTFRTRMTWRSYGRFITGQLIGVVISFLLLALFCSVLGMSVKIAAPLCTICLFVWN